TVNPSGPALYSGSMQDSTAGGTRKTGLIVAGGIQTFSGTNTYSGPTTIRAGTLELLVNGGIPNSGVIQISDSTALSAGSRSDGTFTVNPSQTLKGNGAFNVF